MKKKEAIVVFCAHNDDQIVGAGGTLAKYADEGKDFYTVIFSYGESSHPHLKNHITKSMRIKEAAKSDQILGGKAIYYFGLREGKFPKDIKEKRVKQGIKNMIKSKKPLKIFTHSKDDPHPDHRAVNKTVRAVLEEIDYRGDVYSFDVWNPVNIRERHKPKLVVDVSKTFNKKIEAFKAHKSQKPALITLTWSLYFRAMINGLQNRCRYAEVFYKIQ